MEHLSIVCPRTGEPTGEALPRHEAIRQQAWCRSTNVFVLNSSGEVLCHQRSLAKERMPGVWSTHLGGHVGSHEEYDSNALKELEEESGIRLDARSLVPWRTTRIDTARLWTKEYVTLLDIDANDLKPQPGEVECFAWKSPEQIMLEAAKADGAWCAGTHDFRTEYHCMRSVLLAAHALGALHVPKPMHAWHPSLAMA